MDANTISQLCIIAPTNTATPTATDTATPIATDTATPTATAIAPPTATEMAWSGGRNGWTQAAYAEIQRWNQQPHAQQIRALLLYRWVVGGGSDGQYSILRQSGVQDDFRATVAGNDYRWRW